MNVYAPASPNSYVEMINAHVIVQEAGPWGGDLGQG